MKLEDFKSHLLFIFDKVKDVLFTRNIKPILKLSHVIDSPKYGYKICVIQVIGKNSFLELDALYLINNIEMLRAFSHEDVVAITKLTVSYIKSPVSSIDYEIVEVPAITEENNENIIYRQLEDNTLKMITLDELNKNIDLLQKFSSIDVYTIGYRKGCIDVINEKKEIAKAKQNKRKTLHAI